MRRVVLIVLVLFLVPSSATASWYRCMYDNITRSACCCPAHSAPSKPGPAAPGAVLRATCCCTVTPVASAAAVERASLSATSLSTGVPLVALAVAVPAPAPPSRRATVAVARPRAQDPPDTLFSRRCSLLL